jgi:hypothetical protein
MRPAGVWFSRQCRLWPSDRDVRLYAVGVRETLNATLNVELTNENSSCHQHIVDTRTESAAIAADFVALSTMAWNHCPRSMEFAVYVAAFATMLFTHVAS